MANVTPVYRDTLTQGTAYNLKLLCQSQDPHETTEAENDIHVHVHFCPFVFVRPFSFAFAFETHFLDDYGCPFMPLSAASVYASVCCV